MRELIYNTASQAFYFELYEADGVDLATGATLATGDVKVSKDGGALANVASLPTAAPASSGVWRWTPSSTELQCEQLHLVVVDQTATKVWLDEVFYAFTSGDASALWRYNSDVDPQDVATFDTVAVGDWKYLINTVRRWQVSASPSPTSTSFRAIVVAGSTPDLADTYIDREIRWLIGASLEEASHGITSYTEITDGVADFTTTVMQAAPSAGDQFVMV